MKSILLVGGYKHGNKCLFQVFLLQIFLPVILSMVLGMLMFIVPMLNLCRNTFRKHVKPFPILKINPERKDIGSFLAADFKLIGYDPHDKLEMKMADQS